MNPDNQQATLKGKLRWQSRRGWLELDLLLDKFWAQYGGALQPAELAMLDDWLAMNDEQLWHTLRFPPPQSGELAKKIYRVYKTEKD